MNERILSIIKNLNKYQITLKHLGDSYIEIEWIMSQFDHRTFISFEISSDILRVDIKHGFGNFNAEREITPDDLIQMLSENIRTFQQTSAYLGIKIIKQKPMAMLCTCAIFLLKWKDEDIADAINVHLTDIMNGFMTWNFPDSINVFSKSLRK